MKKLNQILQAAIVVAIALAFIMPGTAIGETKTYVPNSIAEAIKTINTTPETTEKTVLFEDDFESHDDFALDFPPWTNYDGDGWPTWGFLDLDFENEYYVGSFIIFVPSQTTPPLEGDIPHSGEKYAACFDAENYESQDDWLITPQLTTGDINFYVAIHCVSYDSHWLGVDDFVVTETTEGININFWAKTGSDLYDPDRFQIGVSTTDNNPSSFTIISPSPYVEPPVSWTEYSYDYDFTSPELEVEIGGGIGVTGTVTNTGTGDATDVLVDFKVKGGIILAPAGGKANATIDTIAAGDSDSAKITVLGLGRPTITVTATCSEGATASVSADKLVLLFFVL